MDAADGVLTQAVEFEEAAVGLEATDASALSEKSCSESPSEADAEPEAVDMLEEDDVLLASEEPEPEPAVEVDGPESELVAAAVDDVNADEVPTHEAEPEPELDPGPEASTAAVEPAMADTPDGMDAVVASWESLVDGENDELPEPEPQKEQGLDAAAQVVERVATEDTPDVTDNVTATVSMVMGDTEPDPLPVQEQEPDSEADAPSTSSVVETVVDSASAAVDFVKPDEDVPPPKPQSEPETAGSRGLPELAMASLSPLMDAVQPDDASPPEADTPDSEPESAKAESSGIGEVTAAVSAVLDTVKVDDAPDVVSTAETPSAVEAVTGALSVVVDAVKPEEAPVSEPGPDLDAEVPAAEALSVVENVTDAVSGAVDTVEPDEGTAPEPRPASNNDLPEASSQTMEQVETESSGVVETVTTAFSAVVGAVKSDEASAPEPHAEVEPKGEPTPSSTPAGETLSVVDQVAPEGSSLVDSLSNGVEASGGSLTEVFDSVREDVLPTVEASDAVEPKGVSTNNVIEVVMTAAAGASAMAEASMETAKPEAHTTQEGAGAGAGRMMEEIISVAKSAAESSKGQVSAVSSDTNVATGTVISGVTGMVSSFREVISEAEVAAGEAIGKVEFGLEGVKTGSEVTEPSDDRAAVASANKLVEGESLGVDGSAEGRPTIDIYAVDPADKASPGDCGTPGNCSMSKAMKKACVIC